MKRIVRWVTILCIGLMLTGCSPSAADREWPNTDNKPNPPATAEPNAPLIVNRFSDILSGDYPGIIWGEQEELTKQSVVDAARAEGVEITFGGDGSMTAHDPNSGDILKQRADGTWVIVGNDGSEGQIGGQWPVNTFTKLIPEPDFAITVANTSEEQFEAICANVRLRRARAYVEQLSEYGFTLRAQTIEEGSTAFRFTAENEEGYRVSVSYLAGNVTLSVKKPTTEIP